MDEMDEADDEAAAAWHNEVEVQSQPVHLQSEVQSDDADFDDVDFKERLIRVVQLYELIYDKKNRQHMNRVLVAAAWSRVAQTLVGIPVSIDKRRGIR